MLRVPVPKSLTALAVAVVMPVQAGKDRERADELREVRTEP